MASGRAEPESEHWSARRIPVLFLGANPNSTEQRRLDREARGITEKIQSSKHRSSVQLITRWAVRVDDLHEALLKEQPDVVHFTGHGTPEGQIVLESEDGSPKPISRPSRSSQSFRRRHANEEASVMVGTSLNCGLAFIAFGSL